MITRNKVFKNGPSKICGKQPLKMVCLGRQYHFQFFKECLPQILIGSFFARYTYHAYSKINWMNQFNMIQSIEGSKTLTWRSHISIFTVIPPRKLRNRHHTQRTLHCRQLKRSNHNVQIDVSSLELHTCAVFPISSAALVIKCIYIPPPHSCHQERNPSMKKYKIEMSSVNDSAD